MTPDELDAVATFYSFIFRKPVGRHVILDLRQHQLLGHGLQPPARPSEDEPRHRFGETTEDKRFTLLPISCLGACDRAPAMMVDDDLYGPVTPEMMDEILKKYE